MKWIFIVVLFPLFFCHCDEANSNQLTNNKPAVKSEEISFVDSVSLEGEWVVGRLRIVKSMDYPFNKGSIRWGDVSDSSTSFISNLSLKLRGEECVVPLSVFSDLTDVSGFAVNSADKKGYYKVIIVGGGRSLAYKSTVLFRHCTVIERLTYIGTFQDESLEKIFYKFNNLDN